jgi:LPS O-antigen subunit length determinant protein (WzzB/FepE family)
MSVPTEYAPSADLSLVALLRFLGRNKKTVLLAMIVAALGGIVLAFNLTPKYRADVVVAPAEGGGSVGDMGGLGGLASLAGINLGGGTGKKTQEALEYLKSRVFATGFIQRHSLMPVLFAKKWDSSKKQWRDPPDAPTIAQGVNKFLKEVTLIVEDKHTGMITAAEWANEMVAEADSALRERAISEQNRSVDFLRSEAAQTNTVEIGTAISKLTETELKNAMVARTRDAYAFKVIDPAVPPDPRDRYSPNKPLIVATAAFIGLMLGIIIAAIRSPGGQPGA